MPPLFRRLFEAAQDAGADAAPTDDGSLADLSQALSTNQADIGRAMLKAAGAEAPSADEPPPPVDPPPAAAAPPAEAPADPATPPADGDVGTPQQLWEQLEDGRIKLANGHEYANAEAAFAALWHAQDTISRGGHKQTDALPDPEDYEDDEDDDEPSMLAGLGSPLGGEPSDLHDLLEWANQDITAATQWALTHQQQVPEDVLNALYGAWHQSEPAAADAYVLQLQHQAARAEFDQREARMQQMIEPLLRAQYEQEQQRYTQQLQALPHWQHYFPRLDALINADPEIGQALAAMSPAEQYDEIYGLYARLRVDDSVAAQRAAAQAPAATPGAPAATPPAAPPPDDAPVVEGRGGRVEQLPADDTVSIMRRGIAAISGGTDPFSGPPS